MKKITLASLALLFIIACNDKKEPAPDKKPETGTTAAATINVTDWMNWEGGMDVAAVTDTGLKSPNVIFHVAHMVNTPAGSAPSGMLLYIPDSTKPPVIMGFVSTDTSVGKYFGPKIFKGTPFENAPVIKAVFDIKQNLSSSSAKIVAGGHTFECTMSDVGAPYLINRAPIQMPPFYQQGVERTVGKVTFKVDGKEVKLFLPPVGISGGPAAVVSPNGVYAR